MEQDKEPKVVLYAETAHSFAMMFGRVCGILSRIQDDALMPEGLEKDINEALTDAAEFQDLMFALLKLDCGMREQMEEFMAAHTATKH